MATGDAIAEGVSKALRAWRLLELSRGDGLAYLDCPHAQIRNEDPPHSLNPLLRYVRDDSTELSWTSNVSL